MRASETKEQAIIRLYLEGKSNNKIRDILGTRTPKIKEVISQYQQTNQIPPPKRRGRPPIPQHVLNQIMLYTIQNRANSCYEISKLLFTNNFIQISTTSVWRKRIALGFIYKPPKIRQKLNDNHRHKRVIFAHSALESQFDFRNLIFSDESRFCMTPDNMCIWYRKNERDDTVFCEKEKFRESIMIYGAIGLGYKSKLVFCNEGIDAAGYRSVIDKSEMEQDLNAKYGAGNYIFMQDGAPAHSSQHTTPFLQKRFTFIKDWPANSPDLNPIEHLWGAMKRIIKTKSINSKEDLINTVQEIWNNFPQSSIDELILSFKTRLRLVIALNGDSISDILRNGLQIDVNYVPISPAFVVPFENYLARYNPNIDDHSEEILARRTWNPEEVKLLIDKVRVHGNKWTRLASFFDHRTPASLKRKYNQIIGK